MTILEKRLSYWNRGLNDIEIAKLQDVTYGAIKQWRAKHGLASNECRGEPKLSAQAQIMPHAQHPYEPPRVITGQKNRAKRLKCLGNSVVPAQAYPIFKAIMEVSQ